VPTEIIVDTSALIAFFIQSERHHSAVKNYFLQHPHTRWVILSTVFDETVTWIRARVSIHHSIQIGHLLREEHRYLALSEADDFATWEVFRQYDDKAWSYTDCSILVMAHRLKIMEVIAFDEHIRQMAWLGILCIP
jgi:uncharacterized protein